MDFAALQQKLFDIEPTDRAADLRQLAESVGNGPANAAAEAAVVVAPDDPDLDFVQTVSEQESDYNLSELAALAGVTLNESQKTGSAGQLKGKDPMPKAKPRGKHPHVDKLVGEDFSDVSRAAQDSAKKSYTAPDGAERFLKSKFGISPKAKADKDAGTKASAPVAKAGDWKGFLKQHSSQLQKISADPKKKRQFDAMMAKIGEGVEEDLAPTKDQLKGKELDALRNKNVAKMRKDDEAAKKAQRDRFAAMKNESIKEMLYRKLNATK